MVERRERALLMQLVLCRRVIWSVSREIWDGAAGQTAQMHRPARGVVEIRIMVCGRWGLRINWWGSSWTVVVIVIVAIPPVGRSSPACYRNWWRACIFGIWWLNFWHWTWRGWAKWFDVVLSWGPVWEFVAVGRQRWCWPIACWGRRRPNWDWRRFRLIFAPALFRAIKNSCVWNYYLLFAMCTVESLSQLFWSYIFIRLLIILRRKQRRRWGMPRFDLQQQLQNPRFLISAYAYDNKKSTRCSFLWEYRGSPDNNKNNNK